jgi:heme oxygenase
LSAGAIAGIVIGVLIFVAGASVGGYFLYKHLSKKKKGGKAPRKSTTNKKRVKKAP